jgi:hypothetical protein
VDIDLAPLEAFDIDGVVPDGVEEDGDDDIDVEEVLDASQLCQQRKRTLNYTDLKDLCLVRAWENVSLDAVMGTDQTDKCFWQRIEDGFYHHVDIVASPLVTLNHTARSLQGR